MIPKGLGQHIACSCGVAHMALLVSFRVPPANSWVVCALIPNGRFGLDRIRFGLDRIRFGPGPVWIGSDPVWIGSGPVWTGSGLDWIGSGLDWIGSGSDWIGSGLDWNKQTLKFVRVPPRKFQRFLQGIVFRL